MKKSLWLAVVPFALFAGAAWAQDPEKPRPDDKFRPEAPKKDEEEDLTPEKAMQMLKEVQGLQELAADLLNASSQGKALATEEALLKKIKELLKDDKSNSEDAQKKVLEKIERLMGKSEGNQKDAVEKMGEIIRKAKSGQGQGQPDPKQGQQQRQQQQQQGQRAKQPSSPATAPYDPGRNSDPINKFRSNADRSGRWGDLPPRLRESILNSRRELDDYPPEFQQLLKEYFEKITGEK